MPDGVLISDDLLFTSRITTTARAVGKLVAPFRTAELAFQGTDATSPKGIIIDLQNPGLDLDGLMSRIRETWASMPKVIAYGSHVDVETLKAAREAGCTRVMPRSQFVQELETALKDWLS